MPEQNTNAKVAIDTNENNDYVTTDNTTQNINLQTVALVTTNDAPNDTAQSAEQEDYQAEPQNPQNTQSAQQTQEPASDANNAGDANSAPDSTAAPDANSNTSELNSGGKVREYETGTLHDGVTRLGRLDQAYPDNEIDREDIYGSRDGYINKPPYFVDGSSLTPTIPITEDFQAKEEGVMDGGNAPEAGIATVTGMATAIDPEGGPLQYFFQNADGQTQELHLTHGTITLDRLTGEFTYILDNKDEDTDRLAQGEDATDSVTIYVMDDNGLLGTNTLTLNINIEGTNDIPTINEITSHLDDTTLKESGVKNGGNNEETDKKVTASGIIQGTDVDSDNLNGKDLVYTVDGGTISGTTSTKATAYGELSLDMVTGKYTYTLYDADTYKYFKNVNELDQGDTVDQEFTFIITDAHGATIAQDITFVITGTNDKPTLVLQYDDEEENTLAVTEDEDPSARDEEIKVEGKAIGDDVDVDTELEYYLVNDKENEVSSIEDSFGKFEIDKESGDYTYTLANGIDGEPNDVQRIAKDKVVTKEFTVRVKDEHGAWADEKVYVKITGTNDEPTLEVAHNQEDKALAVVEDGEPQEVNGKAIGNDIDNGADLKYYLVNDEGNEVSSIEDSFGKLEIGEGSGEYTYTLANGTDGADIPVQKLAEGDVITKEFTVRVKDEHGAWAAEKVYVKITGTNDEPTLDVTLATSVVESGVVNKDDTGDGNSPVTAVTKATGTFAGADIDNGAVLEYAVGIAPMDDNENPQPIAPSKDDMDTAFSDTPLSVEGLYGTLVLDKDAKTYTYTLVDAKANPLDAEANPTETFTIYVKDDKGAWTSQNITIQIDSTNDIPTLAITPDTPVESVKESGVFDDDDTNNTDQGNSPVDAQLNATGTLQGSDVDTISSNGVKADGSAFYRYGIVADTEHLLASDGNDRSIINTIAGHPNAAAKMLLDKDGNYTFTLGQWKLDANGDRVLDGGNNPIFIEGDAAYNYLAEGETATTTFTFVVYDDHNAWTTQDLTITIKGTNDEPTITATSDELDLKDVADTVEGRLGRNSKDLTADDPDVTNTHIFKGGIANSHIENELISDVANATNDRIMTKYGSIIVNKNGNYTYTLDRDENSVNYKEVKALDNGQAVKDYFVLYVIDTDGATDYKLVTVTITGVDEDPIFSTDFAQNTAVESGWDVAGVIASGTLEATDTDTNDQNALKYSFSDHPELEPVNGWVTFNAVYGDIKLNTATGAYEYVLRQEDTNVEALLPKHNTWENFTIQVTDGDGTPDTISLRVNIDGSNDAPEFKTITHGESTTQITTEPVEITITAPPPEGAATEVFTGTIGAEDVDHATTSLSYSIVLKDGTQGQTDYVDHKPDDIMVTNQYGYIILNQKTGGYTYILDTAKAQHLGAGVEIEETFTIRVTDPLQAFDDIDVVFKITGTDDLPTISGLEASVKEDAPAQAIPEDIAENIADDIKTDIEAAIAAITVPHVVGKIDVADPDDNDEQTFTLTDDSNRTGTYGTLTLYADGSYLYILDKNGINGVDDGENDIQNLNEGQALSDTFEVTVQSGNASNHVEEIKTITIDIAGTNDAPTLVAKNLGEMFKTEKTITGKYEGHSDISDIDDGADLTLGFLKDLDGDPDTPDDMLSVMRGEYGLLSIDKEGNYTYTLDNQNQEIRSLQENEKVTDSFQLSVKDEHEATETKTVTVLIKGRSTDTAPLVKVSGETTIAVQEDETPSNTGTITLDGEEENYNELYFELEDGRHVSSIMDDYGILTISKGDADSGTAKVTYTLHNDATTVQSLPEGTTISNDYTVYAQTGTNRTEAKITVTRKGTNDAPVIEAEPYSEEMQESETSISGQVLADDVDANHTLTYTFSKEIMESGDAISSGEEISFTAEHGTMTLNTTNGKYTYTPKPKDDLGDLPAGEDVSDTFGIVVKDENGATDATEVTVTIKAENTAPTVYDATLSVNEDTKVEASGTPIMEDPDVGEGLTDKLSYSIAKVDGIPSTAIVKGTYGNLLLDKNTGKSTYVLHNGAKKVQSLGKDQTAEDIFTYTVTDSYGETYTAKVTVTINGTNDIPKITVTKSNFLVYEPGEKIDTSDTTDSGTVTIDDIDANDDNHLLSIQFDGTTSDKVSTATPNASKTIETKYGTITLKGDGTYTFAVDDSKAASLNQGEKVMEKAILLVEEETDRGDAPVEQEIVITVVGTNTAPELDLESPAAITPATTLTDGKYVLTGDVSACATDMDRTHTLSYSINSLNNPNRIPAAFQMLQTKKGTYGTLELVTDEDGNTTTYAYTLSEQDLPSKLGALGHESVTDTFTIVVRDEYGAIDQQKITMTIEGDNDTPAMTVSQTNLTMSEDDASITDTAKVNDPDIEDTTVFSIAHYTDADGIEHSVTDTETQTDWGTFTINTDGTYNFTTNAEAQKLAGGEQKVQTFTISVKDSYGVEDTEDITVTINGENDAPTGLSLVDDEEDTPTYDADTMKATGTLKATDIDAGDGDELTFSIIDDDELRFGSVEMTDDDSYSYELNSAKLQELIDLLESEVDKEVKEIFEVQVSDNYTGDAGTEGTDTAEVTLTLSLNEQDDIVVQQAIAEVHANAQG